MVDTVYASSRNPTGVRAVDVSVLDVNLLEATGRLTRLPYSPTEAPVLLLLITRELVYWLLMGEQGVRLRHDFDQPLRVEQLAHELGMSMSGFHQHFKEVMSLNPLQFQKRLRLQVRPIEWAIRMLLTREYNSLFGVPPMHDVQRLREEMLFSTDR